VSLPLKNNHLTGSDPSASRPRLYAHRGSTVLAPENTAAAFDVALAHGSHVLEIDVRMSRDGVLFVTHDQTLQRTTNGHGKVRDQLACELDTLNAAYHFTDLQGRSYCLNATRTAE